KSLAQGACAILLRILGALQLDHAAARLGGRLIWTEVDLEVQEGEFVAILGPNGAGKSTLLKALLGVVPLAEGSVRVFGRPVRRARMMALDEPLESLDLNNQQAISELIRSICQTRGVTVLLVAHDINPILPFVDRVVYVAGGHVLSGKPQEVIRTETLTALYGTPVEVLHTSDGRIVVVGQYEPVTHHPADH